MKVNMVLLSQGQDGQLLPQLLIDCFVDENYDDSEPEF